MAFTDRIVDYPGRFVLTDADSGTTLGTYDMTRDEGTVYQAGTLLNANNLNNPDIQTLSINGAEVKDHLINIGSSGNWSWRKWSSGHFEAWLSADTGSTGTLTQLGSTGIYYSAASEVIFPSAIGITAVKGVSASVMPPQNYVMSYFLTRLTTSHVYFSYLRYGSSTAVSNISYRLHITGTWA